MDAPLALSPLLSTKLYAPPSQPTFVVRPRLLARLDEVWQPQGALALVTAPAGFGKSSLIAAWCRARTFQYTWLSLDNEDNDPQRFVAYLLAAIETVIDDSTALDEIKLMARAAQVSPAALIELLIPVLHETLTTQTILGLDDYHVIDAAPIHEAVQRFIEYHPPLLRVAITARADPPFPLARWRARGSMVQVRQADLRFTFDECDAFLKRVTPLALTSAQVAALEASTEGWIAGLQLAGLSLRGTNDATHFIESFTGSHRYVFDFLVEEVLRQQSDARQNFLLETSILDRFCADLCDAVTQRANSQTELEQMERGNLFLIALDETREWYRYHHLFAQVLQHRLRQAAPTRIAELHRRASEWFEQQNLIPEAIQHALAGQQMERATQLIAHQADALLKRGEYTTLYRWLEQLPQQQILARPALAIQRAHALVYANELERAQEFVATVQTQLDVLAQNAPTQAALQEWYNELLVIRVKIVSRRNNWKNVIELAQRALDETPPNAHFLRGQAWNHLGLGSLNLDQDTRAREAFQHAYHASSTAGDWYTALSAFTNYANNVRLHGELAHAQQLLQQGLELAAAHHAGSSPSTSRLNFKRAEIFYEQNKLSEMEHEVETAMQLASGGQDAYWRIISHSLQAKLECARGEIENTAQTLAHAWAELRASQHPAASVEELVSFQVYFWVKQNDAQALAWAEQSGVRADDVLTHFTVPLHRAYARVLVMQGNAREAVTWLERLDAHETANEHHFELIGILALQAIALEQSGAHEQALATLTRALELGSAEGFVRSFVDEGESVQKLLLELKHNWTKAIPNTTRAPNHLLDYVEILLNNFPAPLHTTNDMLQSAPFALVEPLTERELQVLRLLAQGFTNQQISAALIISVGTTKKHLNNIFGKLSATSRTQALIRARELGLLE